MSSAYPSLRRAVPGLHRFIWLSCLVASADSTARDTRGLLKWTLMISQSDITPLCTAGLTIAEDLKPGDLSTCKES